MAKKEYPLMFSSLNESLNDRENRFYGFDAVQATLYQLFCTPRNTLPENPSLGFDLSDFLFRSRDSQMMEVLENELRNMISIVLGMSDVSVRIVRPDHSDTTEITITYRHEGESFQLPLAIQDDGTLLFRQIVVR